MRIWIIEDDDGCADAIAEHPLIGTVMPIGFLGHCKEIRRVGSLEAVLTTDPCAPPPNDADFLCLVDNLEQSLTWMVNYDAESTGYAGGAIRLSCRFAMA